MVTVLRTYKVSVSLLGTLCTSSFVFGSAVSLGINFELKKTFKSDLGIDQSSFLWNYSQITGSPTALVCPCCSTSIWFQSSIQENFSWFIFVSFSISFKG